MRILDRRYEMMAREELEQLQLERLQALLARLKRNVRRYREIIGDARIESLEDVAQLPITTPEDLADAFPYGMFALPLREVVRLHPALGFRGKPLVTGYTRNDLAQWGRLVARQLVASGVTPNDVVQVCLGSGVYRGASGYVAGAETIEASVIAEEPFHIDSQLAMLRSYRPTMLVTTPDNARELMETMEHRKIDPPSLHLRTVLLSRPVSPETRQALEAGLLVAVRCNFGVDEILDPGFCVECDEGHFHVNEDQFFVETQDGELVVTTLGREAVPLLRYRTRIGCTLRREKCACGRTGAIVEPGARLDGRLRVREAPLYECQIAEVLEQTRAAGHRYHVEVGEREVIIAIEMSSELFADVMWMLTDLQHEIQNEFKTRLGLDADIRLITPKGNG
ncbi:MAG: phenylacetate--CoA ligase [Candidatus Hydrogenedentota bacterium]